MTRTAAVIAVAAALSACSSGTAPVERPTTSDAPTGHGSLAHCLDEHDVPAAPGPGGGPPPGIDTATWERAMQACSSLAPGPAN